MFFHIVVNKLFYFDLIHANVDYKINHNNQESITRKETVILCWFLAYFFVANKIIQTLINDVHLLSKNYRKKSLIWFKLDFFYENKEFMLNKTWNDLTCS